MRWFLNSKIHKATVTEANLDYVGSITIDQELLEKVDLKEGEKSLIKNRIYSKIKRLFIQIVEKDRQNNKIFHVIYYGIYFMVTFRTRKSISTAFRTWMKS